LTTDYTDATHAGRLIAPVVNFPAKLLFALVTLALFAAPAVRAQREKLPPDDLAFVEKNWPEAKKTTTGIRYIILKAGQGENAKPGDKVSVLYIGRLLNGTVFDQNQDREKPFPVHVKRGEVIEGWDQILQFMKKGEKRLVIIPPELAYGTRGQPPSIPRSATLVFEMEVLDIERN
jgi:FKBP-type peptidyl-prolyl cis-trans isomerase